MWRQVAPDHWHKIDERGFVVEGAYELSGWWHWYRCGKKTIKGVTVAVEVARGGPWPTKELAWQDINGKALGYRRTA